MHWIRRGKVHATNIVIAVSLAAATSAFADMSLTGPARWIEHDVAINQLSIDHKSSIPIGGRFICSVEQNEDRMVKALLQKGLAVADSDQCEIVAFKHLSTDIRSVRETIASMLQIAGELGYRLISVEAGDFERGHAIILASEEGYIPWWQKNSPNFPLVDRFVRSTMSQANLDAESIEAIVLYLDNREYEMAFEGLFLELINSGKTLKLDTNECMALALQLKLDKTSVFDHQFWSKFEKYLQKIQDEPTRP